MQRGAAAIPLALLLASSAAAAAPLWQPRTESTCRGNSLLQVQTSKTLTSGFDPAEAAGTEADDEGETVGRGLVCRGAHPLDNRSSYFELHVGTPSISACKELCLQASVCKGIEYSHDFDSGRCEVWTRPEGIGATARRSNSTCLRLQPYFEALGEACRGANPSIDSQSYYELHTGVKTLEACKELCIRTEACKGVEHGVGGRCEIWTRIEGIGATQPRSGYTCLRYGRAFASAGEGPTTDKPTPTPTTTTKDTLVASSAIAATTAAVIATSTSTLPITTTSTSTATTRVASQLNITSVTDYVFSNRETHDITVVNLTASTALVCSTTLRKGSCTLLNTSGSAPANVRKFDVGDGGEISRLRLAGISEERALACYVDHHASTYVKEDGGTAEWRPAKPVCRVLSLTPSGVAKGEAMSLHSSDEVIFSLTPLGLSPSMALICYDRLVDDALEGVCTAATISGASLIPSSFLEIGRGNVEFGPEIISARFSERAALVCFREGDHSERAMCTMLTLNGIALQKGEDLVLSEGHFHSLSAVGLSDTKAIVCFKDFTTKPQHSACSALAVSGTSLVEVDRVTVFTGKPFVARLSEQSALVCSCDSHHTHQTVCAALELSSQFLAKGPERVMQDLSNAGARYSLTGLSASSAVLCYEDQEDDTARRGVCTAMTISQPAAPPA